jgi:hypothetical protein
MYEEKRLASLVRRTDAAEAESPDNSQYKVG